MWFRAIKWRWPKSRRRSAFPVRTQSRRLALEVEDDHFGDELPVPAIPLKGELHVGAGSVAMVERVIAKVIAVVDDRRAMEQLEEADRHVPMNLRHPARTDLELGMKPVAAFMGVIIPGTGVLFQPLPFVPSDKIAAVGTVDHPFVEMGAFK